MAQQQLDRDAWNQVNRNALVLSKTNITTKLDESPDKVTKMWNKIIRPALFAELESAGPDWVAAANFRSNIPASAPYVAAQVLATDDSGAPSLSMPIMRQRAMLALLKRYLPEDGESMRLIKHCVHFGGRIGPAQAALGDKQALMILDER